MNERKIMSLIRARRERMQSSGSGPRKPPSLLRLLMLLGLVFALIWWLGQLGS